MNKETTIDQFYDFQDEHNIRYMALDDAYTLQSYSQETINDIKNIFLQIEEFLSGHLVKTYNLAPGTDVDRPFMRMFSFRTDPDWLERETIPLQTKRDMITTAYRNTGKLRILSLGLVVKNILSLLNNGNNDKSHTLGFFLNPFPMRDEDKDDPFTGYKGIELGVIVDNSFAIASVMSSKEFRDVLEQLDEPIDQVFTSISEAIQEEIGSTILACFQPQDLLEHAEHNATIH